MMKDECRELVDLYSLDLLAGAELCAFEKHLDQCDPCRATLADNRKALACLDGGVDPSRIAREWVMDFAKAPSWPIDLDSRAWEEVSPGVRMHVFGDDTPRSVRSQLMWALPGAARPTHRHMGEEAILVLQGGLIVGDRDYRIGDICRVTAGSPHSEKAVSEAECVCFVVHRASADGPTVLHGAPERSCLSCVFYPQHRPTFYLPARRALFA
jgi:quercetin dioxygenase-like cupin family protein